MQDRGAAGIAAVLSDRDILQSRNVDLTPALKAMAGDRSVPVRDPSALKRLRTERDRLAKMAPKGVSMTPAQCLALAYPDRIALRRPGKDARFLLSGGMGVAMDGADPIAGDRLLVVADMGNPQRGSTEPAIRRALPLRESDLRDVMGPQITWVHTCEWSKRDRKVLAKSQEQWGALALKSQLWKDAPAGGYCCCDAGWCPASGVKADASGATFAGTDYDGPGRRVGCARF